MILDIAKQFNWLDILIAILCLRICYVAIKSGFPVELFKILGTIFSIYLSFHYFTALSDFIKERFPVSKVPVEFIDFLCFVTLVITGYSVFLVLRKIILNFIKMEAVPKLSRWGGLILGIGRFFLFTSLLVFILAISSFEYFKRSVDISYTGKRLFKIAPSVYSGIWNGFASKFMTKEELNQTALDIELSDSAQE